MEISRIQRVSVWSSPVRLAHWLMAVAVLILLLTGWLMNIAPDVGAAALDYHYIFGYVLIAGLALRLYQLVLGTGAAHWGDFIPKSQQLKAAGQTLRFYLSFGRYPLPAWYAHNPFWGPVYPALLAVMFLEALTGLSITAPYRFAGFDLPTLHLWGAKFIGFIAAAHIVAVFVHDLKGTGSDVSAMINGHRIFVIEKPKPLSPKDQVVPLEDLLSSKHKDRS